MVQGITLKVDSYLACQEIARFLYVTQVSLPCSQKHATGPYPEPDECS